MEYLAAHLSKIHGLDWHSDSEHILATSSQDNSVKVSGTPVGMQSVWGAVFGRHQFVFVRQHFLLKESYSMLAQSVCFRGACACWGAEQVNLVM